MMMYMEPLKIIVLSSILFVWVVRYDNIITEFKQYNYPNWLRDLVGILKISFAIMINQSNPYVIKTGAVGIAFLMTAAVFTHLRVKNPVQKMLPSLSLLIISLLIYFSN